MKGKFMPILIPFPLTCELNECTKKRLNSLENLLTNKKWNDEKLSSSLKNHHKVVKVVGVPFTISYFNEIQLITNGFVSYYMNLLIEKKYCGDFDNIGVFNRNKDTISNFLRERAYII